MLDSAHLTEMRHRYEIERERRLRPDGNAQYEDFDPRTDPWTDPIEREPLRDTVDVAIVGAGLSGLIAGVKLRLAGVERIRLIDRAGDVAGTWYWSRYPAAQCDVESYIYMPLLEDVQHIPEMKYAYQPEIFAHCQALARKYDLYSDACFQTDVVELAWNEADRMWTVSTDRGDAMRARFVIVAGGFLQRPKLPGIPGLSEFRGKLFHTSRWDYSYTGGHPGPDGGGLPNLHDKSVGLIGTGASGLQCVTPVARAARHLYVFQRTPSVVLPRNNRPTDPAWVESLQPGWQAERTELYSRRGTGILDEPDPVDDQWTQTVAPLVAAHRSAFFGGSDEREHAEMVDLQAMDAVRRRVADTVRDPQTAATLMPYYSMLCKRPLFHDEYLESFNRPNVTLVDTDGCGPEKITQTGVVVAGREYEVDCLILGTGFDTGRGLLASWGLDLVGRDGLRLSSHWGTGMRTFHGVHVRNFPNLFLDSVTQTAGNLNYTANVVEIADYIAYVIAQARERGCTRVEPTSEAEEQWVTSLAASEPDAQVEFFRACTPGYYSNEGHLENIPRLGLSIILGRSTEFYGEIREWRKDGALRGLELE